LRKIRTIEEFSAASGISRATVSKYFNDPDSARPATRERMEKELNPIPEWRIGMKDKYPAYIT
jgi:transcriptional regulator with XRE-family HTH domain